MASFVGLHVEVTLKLPPGTLVNGRVKEVIAGQTLALENAFLPADGTQLGGLMIQGSNIADVQVIEAIQPAYTPVPPPQAFPTPSDTQTITPTQTQTSQQISDPAILSYERSPSAVIPAQVQSTTAGPTAILPDAIPPRNPRRERAGTAIHVDPAENNARQKKRASKSKPVKAIDPPPVLDVELSRNGNDMNNTVKRGKGWRQTPLLQSTIDDEQPRKSRRKQRTDENAQNGWATEDATDIQDMGEFDFEANHKLFDKKQVFDELRRDDTTADEDRLVSHNKLPRKNLLPTENVLSSPKIIDDVQVSEADTETDLVTGRSTSRHSISGKRLPLRTNSILHEGRTRPTASTERAMSRSALSTGRANRPTPLSVSSGLRSGRDSSPRSAASITRPNNMRSSINQSEVVEAADSTFIVASTSSVCLAVHPDALISLEVEAESTYGLSLDSITENAGRSIAELAMSFLGQTSDIRRPSRTNSGRIGMNASGTIGENTPPVMVILAAVDTIDGAYALAAARHLTARNVAVIISEVKTGNESHPQYVKQASTIKRMIRSGSSISRGSWTKANEYIKNLSGPPVAIIDALPSATWEAISARTRELHPTCSQEVRSMIDWANRSRASKLSVSVPGGVDNLQGIASIVDGEPLAIRPDKVLGFGVPLIGVLEAVKNGENWDVLLADTGINIALDKTSAVDFGRKWTVQLALSSQFALSEPAA